MVARTDYSRTMPIVKNKLINSVSNYQKLNIYSDNFNEGDYFSDDSIINPDNIPTTTSQKPKSILINHDQDEGFRRPKPNRFVSFTDDNKKPLTSSIYYGVKSYLHHFYEPANKTSDENSFKDDDFEFAVEPGRRRKNYWVFSALLIGIMLLIPATCLLIISNTTSVNSAEIIENPNDSEFLHQKSIAFGKRIESWQFFGLIFFCAGGIIVMVTLLIYVNEDKFSCLNLSDQVIYPSLEETNAWIRYAKVQPPCYDNRIPLLEEVAAVQQMDQPIK